MLDVGDNLERAYTAVPEEALKGHDKAGKPISSQGAVTLLNGLVNGVKLTEKIFDQVRHLGIQFKVLCMAQTLAVTLLSHIASIQIAHCCISVTQICFGKQVPLRAEMKRRVRITKAC